MMHCVDWAVLSPSRHSTLRRGVVYGVTGTAAIQAAILVLGLGRGLIQIHAIIMAARATAGEVVLRVAVVPGRDASPVLQLAEQAFDDVSRTIEGVSGASRAAADPVESDGIHESARF